MPPASSEDARWFSEEVQPHESALRVYLKTRFPGVSDQDDVVQETYTRLLRAKMAGTIRHTRAFLFTTARNAAIDFLRRQGVRLLRDVPENAEWCVLNECRTSAPDILDHEQQLQVLADAVHALPERCREVVVLRYIDGLSYREVAERMGVSPETVKTQLVKGLRRCAEYCAARGIESPFGGSGEGSS